MKRRIVVLMGIMAILTIITFAMQPRFYTSQEQKEYIQTGDYHFILILKEKDSFWQDVEKGAREYARANNITLSVLKQDYFEKENIHQMMDRAIESNPDGIMAYGLNSEESENLINKSIELNIPWICLGEDVLKSNRSGYIGINDYYVGKLMTRKMIDHINYYGDLAIVMNSEESSFILSAIKEMTNERKYVNVIETAYIDMNRVNTYKIIEDIVQRNPELKGIICTDPYATYVAGQVIVRLNKVGQIKIVGIGELEETQRFVEKGVIQGAVMRSPVIMGEKAVETMHDMKKDELVNDAIFIDVSYFEGGIHDEDD